LVRDARSAARTKSTYLSVLYHRLAARRGANRAAVAVAHAMLVSIHHVEERHKLTCRAFTLGVAYRGPRIRVTVEKREAVA
jgi:hypothetical protein